LIVVQKHPQGVGELSKFRYDNRFAFWAPKEDTLSTPIVDFSEFSFDNLVADQDKVHETNPHRYELCLLTGILFIDDTRIVGYYDVPDEPFWARGHFPGLPMMPGVLISEVAAQLTAYLAAVKDIRQDSIIGLAGLQNVRFRSPVKPGDQLIVMAKEVKSRKGAMLVTDYQAFVGETLASEGQIKGVAIQK
jgi:3-hydroxyacyl-[acyl-carrier-protein] dehydratase